MRIMGTRLSLWQERFVRHTSAARKRRELASDLLT